MGEGNAAIQSGGGLPLVGGGGSVMTHSYCWLWNHFKYSIQICDGFWTIQEHLIFKTGDAGLPYIKIYLFFKTLIALKVKCFWNRLEIFWIQEKILERYAKNWIFHQNNILQYYFQSLCMALYGV
jgi:hypothetical protein